ncbi:TPA: hypothetical protein DDX46_04410 [Candidatus Saccharibacteria bacterium]|jgi:Zn-finger nucleic acid-binding protein|nr:MAG: hypothetical protein UW38_C0001G0707 [Candidatus Saccharibacteria bacterium GW2011_GWC2_44_17]OGL24005.1 MAG: hypothetical protein A2791_03845 [Candidatus Saccharibacteria bacterium RIFCSPHIGHO2_01_FULL_46_30]OGL33676.1 MAG: hypothetical protein A3E20_02905 [Candidatus Saccharibacteria bacterium RIFCSPHIGHO2_12_FULL_47_16]HBH77958.1 hypothetical protein [Candidatus Saccharibacteria bacterium]
MQCPIDKTDLVMTDRQGVEIDYCPKCRGVWLDRGELDKIIERGTAQAPAAQAQQPYQEPNYPSQQYDKHGNQSGSNQSYPRKKRKESFLGDLFDF